MAKQRDYLMAYMYTWGSCLAGTLVLFYPFRLYRFVEMVSFSLEAIVYFVSLYMLACVTVLLSCAFIFERVSRAVLFRSSCYFVAVGFLFPVVYLTLEILVLWRVKLPLWTLLVTPVVVFVLLAAMSYGAGKLTTRPDNSE